MAMRKNIFILLFIFFLISGCNNKKIIQIPEAANVLHTNENNLTDLIIYDIFSPPVASRIYVYTSLAAHEAPLYLSIKTCPYS